MKSKNSKIYSVHSVVQTAAVTIISHMCTNHCPIWILLDTHNTMAVTCPLPLGPLRSISPWFMAWQEDVIWVWPVVTSKHSASLLYHIKEIPWRLAGLTCLKYALIIHTLLWISSNIIRNKKINWHQQKSVKINWHQQKSVKPRVYREEGM